MQGESHGGVYLVDLESGNFDQVIDWNDQDISWEGRGWDRGLRGIAFHNENIYLAASDELFVYDRSFKIIESYRNKYLKHCHEICINGNELYLTSTGFDALLVFSLPLKRFIRGYRFEVLDGAAIVKLFDPTAEQGPRPSLEFHLNSVTVEASTIYVSGLRGDKIWCLLNNEAEPYSVIPLGTHNARPHLNGALVNDTANDRVLFQRIDGSIMDFWQVPRYEESGLTWTHLTQDRARQAFARGMCILENGMIAIGSSPSTISVFSTGQRTPVQSIQLTNDIRNSIHGLEVWPY